MSHNLAPFGRVLTAMVTPFDSNEALDIPQLHLLIDHLIAQGSDALVVSGTTGEAPTLNTAEKAQLFTETLQHVNGRIPVIAGTGSYSTRETIALSQQAEALGVQGLLVVNPYYNKPSQADLVVHFKAVADAVQLPIILYNHPGRTGVNLGVDALCELAQHPNIVAVKDSSGDLVAISEIHRRLGNGFCIYSGDDPLTLPMLSLGAQGVVSVVSHVAGPAVREMVNAFFQGNISHARRLHEAMLPLVQALFCAPSPAPTKAALAQLGIHTGGLRLPLQPLSESLTAELSAILETTQEKLKTVQL